MRLIKCPRCELNYMSETDKMCSVCRREMRGESESFELIEMCSECGENPVVPGREYCAACLKEMAQRTEDDNDDGIIKSAPNIDIGVSEMDEIDIGDDIDDESFDEDNPFDDEDDEDDEDDDEGEDE